MKDLALRCRVLVAISAIIVSGCSINNVYEIDTVDNSPAEFEGIEDLYSNRVNTVNILFVHGMGYHPVGEVSTRNYQDRIAQELGFEQIVATAEPKELMLKGSQIVGGHLGWRQFKHGSKQGRFLNVFELSWDAVTESIQKALLELDGDFYERGGLTKKDKGREKHRAIVNRELKRFINRSFADPVIYLGSFGDDIRFIVAQGIGEIDAILGTYPGYRDGLEDNPFVFISDSLGSSVVFDTVNKSLDSVKTSDGLSDYRDAATRFAGHAQQIFMNANQLPLIELARLEGPNANEGESEWLNRYPCGKSSTLGGLRAFGEFRKGIKAADKQRLQIVAFTDPNDALSYYLTTRFREKCGSEGMRIINVLLSNARLNYLFIVADPGKAHASGFKTNDDAIQLVTHGHHD